MGFTDGKRTVDLAARPGVHRALAALRHLITISPIVGAVVLCTVRTTLVAVAATVAMLGAFVGLREAGLPHAATALLIVAGVAGTAGLYAWLRHAERRWTR